MGEAIEYLTAVTGYRELMFIFFVDTEKASVEDLRL